MKNIVNLIDKKQNCCGCGACVQACAKKAIQMKVDSEGFLYPSLEDTCCNECGRCIAVCPVLNKPEAAVIANAYAATNADESIRMTSSSGGVFAALAEKILSSGGIVFGAAFSDDFSKVLHVKVSGLNSLKKLKGSKYVQSDIRETYSEAKNELDRGTIVLFSGTPCEIAGLKMFLGKEYDNLYTCDVVCHGSPSPLVWEKYLNCKQLAVSSQAEEISFRNKKFGWKKYSLNIIFNNGGEYSSPNNSDTYLRGFISNLYLRPSCHICSFKGSNRTSDITLADFWGGNTIVPEMDDDKGLSLVLAYSQKGEELLKSSGCYLKSVDFDLALKNNQSYFVSSGSHPYRKKFFKELAKESDVEKLISNILKRVNYKRLLIVIKNKIKKFL